MKKHSITKNICAFLLAIVVAMANFTPLAASAYSEGASSDIIEVTLTSAIDGSPFIVQFNPLTNRLTSFYSNGEESFRYVDSEEKFWELVEINVQVTQQMFAPFAEESRGVDAQNHRNMTVIDFESRTRVEYDAHGNRVETLLGDEFYEFFSHIEIDDYASTDEELPLGGQITPFFNLNPRSTFVPTFPTPDISTSLVGGQFFVTHWTHRLLVLRVMELPWGMPSIDVFFTNAIGDDRLMLANVGLSREIRHRIRFPGEAYGARVSNLRSSGNALLWFFAGTPVGINLDANGGNVTPTWIEGLAGMPIVSLPTPTWPELASIRRSFVGWFNTIEPVGGTRFVDGSTLPNNGLNLTARWHNITRHMPMWWPAANSGTTTIPFRVQPGLPPLWARAIDEGTRSWNNITPSTRVAFQTNTSSSNLVTADAPNWANPNLVGVAYTDGVGNRITNFIIILHTTRIPNGAVTLSITTETLAMMVMAHELGHIIGLEDNPLGTNDSIMLAPHQNRIITRPTAFDITSVNMLYN